MGTVPTKLLKNIKVKGHVRKTDGGEVAVVKPYSRLEEVNQMLNSPDEPDHSIKAKKMLVIHHNDIVENRTRKPEHVQEVVSDYNRVFTEFMAGTNKGRRWERIHRETIDDIVKYYVKNLSNVKAKYGDVDVLDGIDFNANISYNDRDLEKQSKMLTLLLNSTVDPHGPMERNHGFQIKSVVKHAEIFDEKHIDRIQKFIDINKNRKIDSKTVDVPAENGIQKGKNGVVEFGISSAYLRCLSKQENRIGDDLKGIATKMIENNKLDEHFQNWLTSDNAVGEAFNKSTSYLSFVNSVNKHIEEVLPKNMPEETLQVLANPMTQTLLDRLVTSGNIKNITNPTAQKNMFEYGFILGSLAYKSDNPKKQFETFQGKLNEYDEIGNLGVEKLLNDWYSSSNNETALLLRRSYRDLFGVPGKYVPSSEGNGIYPLTELKKDNLPDKFIESWNEIYSIAQEHLKGVPSVKLYRGMSNVVGISENKTASLMINPGIVSTSIRFTNATRFAGLHPGPKGKEREHEKKTKKTFGQVNKILKDNGVKLNIADDVKNAGLNTSGMWLVPRRDGGHVEISTILSQNAPSKNVLCILTGEGLKKLKSRYPAVRFTGGEGEHILIT